MADVRACDGPGCESFAPLQGNSLLGPELGVVRSEDYITVTRKMEPDLHFCCRACLMNYLKEEFDG